MNHRFDRRRFLTAASAAGGVLALGPRALADAARAAREPVMRRLVVLFLDGGNDALNTLVPLRDARYREARPSLAIGADAALGLDGEHGLHPALARLVVRARGGGVAFLRGVGYAPPNLSHFTSRDVWGTARIDPIGARTGWIGRAVDHLLQGEREAAAMIAVGSVQAPLAMRAERNVAYALPDAQSFQVRAGSPEHSGAAVAARRRALEALNRAGAARGAERVAGAVQDATESIAKLERALAVQAQVAYPETKLARDLALVARAIEADLPTRAFHVAQSGYDTHAAQAVKHAELLGELDGALDAFLRDLEAIGRLDATLVLAFSEFGRRVAENGVGAGAGTDHGAAGLAFLCGGGAAAGLFGSPWRLDAADEHGNLAHTVDFRSLYADVLEGWFELSSEPLLGGTFARAGVVRA